MSTKPETTKSETKKAEAVDPVVENTTAKPPRQKTRPIAELEATSPAAMTRDEAMKYIKYLRDEKQKLESKIHALEDNIKSAFAKAEYVTRITAQIEKIYQEHLEYIESSIKNLKIGCDCAVNVAAAHINNLKKGV